MKRLGLIGRTLAHSFSPKYFSEKFRREGIDGEWSYDLFELPEADCVEELIRTTPDLCGFNVTIPYKRDIIAHLDSLSGEARDIGAVNCVRIDADGRRTGYNTDADGIRVSLDKLLCDEKPEAALVLGTGGASQAVQYVLAQRDIPFSIVSRDGAKGNYTYHDLSPEIIGAHPLIVNASPVGTYPRADEAPRIPYAYLTPRHRLFDLVYNPERTLFMQYGEQRGARTLSGLDMLHAQAESAWRIWRG